MKAFGPGVVPILNLLSLGVDGPPVVEFQAAVLIAPGDKVRLRDGFTPGVHMFECVHPWMRSVITAVAGDRADDD